MRTRAERAGRITSGRKEASVRSTLWSGFGVAIILSLAFMGMAQVAQGQTDDSKQTS